MKEHQILLILNSANIVNIYMSCEEVLSEFTHMTDLLS